MDLAGRTFGRWTVLDRAERARYWNCVCECGNRREVFDSSLTTGSSPSCGCITRTVFAARWVTHGHAGSGSRSIEFETWCRIRQRCENPRNPGFKNYGARGIAVCDRWREDFQHFLDDVGYRPGPGFSLDRIDNERGYEPGNCRWATAKEQARNRRSSRFIVAHGQRKTVAEWSELTGVSPTTISRRLASGMTPEQAVASGKYSNHGNAEMLVN
jgi:hypothetical protein